MNPLEREEAVTLVAYRTCTVEDCTSKLKSKLYCNKHWKRYKAHGTTDLVPHYKYGYAVKKTPEYRTWKRIKTVTSNPNFPKYVIYGGRGIKMSERWQNNFSAFLADMGKRPDPTYSIERVNVNSDYEPNNCIWADKTTQARNQRTRKDNTSGFRGVYVTPNNTYKVLIQVNGKQKLIGTYKLMELATKARIEAERKYWT